MIVGPEENQKVEAVSILVITLVIYGTGTVVARVKP